MADSAGPDKTLLERLNALKPTTISLDDSPNSGVASAIEPAKPATREDGLSERLKSLRSQADSLPESGTADFPVSRISDHEESQPRVVATTLDTVSNGKEADTRDDPRLKDQDEDIADPLLDTDEQTLEELLADLGSDEQWLEEVAAEVSRSKDEEHQRVSALLEELGKVSLEENEDTKSEDWKRKHGEDSDEDDNSDDDKMKREAEDALAKAMDEAEWEEVNLPTTDTRSSRAHNTGANKHEPLNKSTRDRLDLPTVPTELQDQPNPTSAAQPDDHFEADIAARMAALKGLGGTDRTLPAAPTSQVDELGLPMAPTFAPADRPVTGVYKRYGYTDEDSKTWCTVCLEDGTIRCIGCDDDIYCARCWKEMHVGPSAGYEERGHQWEKFTRIG